MLLVAGTAQAAMGLVDARHLLNRTGFDARIEAIDACAALSRREAVDRLLSGTRAIARTPIPAGAAEWSSPLRLRTLSDAERLRALAEMREQGLELRGWWIAEMIATDSPLTERMTLFWHNHFATSVQKVRSPALMQRQNALLRRHAFGSFGELLHAVSKDPAMLVYLDTARSRRDRPNENFAREVMELFTLGEGNYTERDVKEAARAFTGWSIDPETGQYLFRPGIHDEGVKTVLGKAGSFRGEDVLDILLARPETADFISAKLWREFVSPAPRTGREKADLARAARQFRETGYSIRAALRELLLSESFWDAENRAALIKAPVDVVIGALRQFRVEVRDPTPFAFVLRNLGQDLFAPPNVKGWPGGEAWINSQTLLARRQFLDRILRVDEARMTMQASPTTRPPARRFMQAMMDLQFSAGDWLRPFEGRPMPETAHGVLLAVAPNGEAPRSGQGLDLVRAIVADPVYQLR
jgi:uncharacterized protein (DUF1800 family)